MDNLVALYHVGKHSRALTLRPAELAEELASRAVPGDTLHRLTTMFCDDSELLLLIVQEQLSLGKFVRV